MSLLFEDSMSNMKDIIKRMSYHLYFKYSPKSIKYNSAGFLMGSVADNKGGRKMSSLPRIH